MAARSGERRLQILQTLAAMLENPRGEKVTTAALAARLSVSEAALYRHFASKAQRYEGLIEFIETTLFSFINKITGDTEDGVAQEVEMAGLAKEIRFVRGQQIDHRLQLLRLLAARQQAVVTGEIVESVFAQATLQAADEQYLLRIAQIDSGQLVDQALKEAELLVADG
jgi:AcrR family transcriptional regulator